MLQSMTIMQYEEWLAFFAIQNGKSTPQGTGYGPGREAQQRLSGDIFRSLTGYQQRRDRATAKA